MRSARSGNGLTRVKTIDKQLKNESVKKEDAEFCGENLIVRKLNVCFIQWQSVGEHFFVLSVYLRILPYALTDILGRCAVEKNVG